MYMLIRVLVVSMYQKRINRTHTFPCQGLARLSIKSRSQQLLLSLGWSRSQHPLNLLVSKSLGLNISKNFQSQKVLVPTSFIFLVLQIHCQYIIWNITTILLISDQIVQESETNYQFPFDAVFT